MTRLTSLTDNDGEPHCSQGGEVYSYLSRWIFTSKDGLLCVCEWQFIHQLLKYHSHHSIGDYLAIIDMFEMHFWLPNNIAAEVGLHTEYFRRILRLFVLILSEASASASEDNDRLKINVACSLANYHLTTTSKVGGECSAKVSQNQQNDTVLSLAGMPVFWIL